MSYRERAFYGVRPRPSVAPPRGTKSHPTNQDPAYYLGVRDRIGWGGAASDGSPDVALPPLPPCVAVFLSDYLTRNGEGCGRQRPRAGGGPNQVETPSPLAHALVTSYTLWGAPCVKNKPRKQPNPTWLGPPPARGRCLPQPSPFLI